MKRIYFILILLFTGFMGYSQITLDLIDKISNDNLVMSGALPYDAMFGGAIANIGDLNDDGNDDIAVGSHGYDGRDGGIYILFLNEDASIQSYTIIADGMGGLPSGSLGPSPFGSLGNMFGSCVEGIGDLNNDGVEDIIVGAREGFEATEWWHQSIGSYWVLFLNEDGTVNDYEWLYSQSSGWQDSLPIGCQLTYDIKNVGDVDGDGVTDLLSSAILYPNVYGTDTVYSGGMIYMFMNTDGTVKRTHILTGIAQQDDEFFGCAIDKIGDVNDDGVTDLAVGAYGYDANSNLEGGYYVLLMQDDTTVQSWVRIAEDEGGFSETIGLMDIFGKSITGLGDIDGDCIPDLAVSTPWNDDVETKMGAFYIHCLNADGTVKSSQRFDGNTTGISGYLEANDRFATYIEFLGDLNKDEVPEIGIGTIYDDDGQEDAGAVYIYSLNGIIDCPTNITSTKGVPGFYTYPNPCVDIINVDLSNFDGEKDIELINAQGQITHKQSIFQNHLSFDVNYLPPGIYTIMVTHNHKKFQSKFIIQ